MIDQKFTEQIAKWLQSDHESTEKIQEGAMLLLQLNRDSAMHQRILRGQKRMLSFLEYKLRRFLQLRQDGQTIKDVVKIDREIVPQIQVAVETEPAVEEEAETLPLEQPAQNDGDTGCYIRKGIRPDHENLPEKIQSLWAKNAERWKKIKEAYETLKALEEPCDRYEYLKILKETWYTYKEDMARYDEYQLTGELQDDGSAGVSLSPEDEKELTNADSYISKNLQRLTTLVSSSEEDGFTEDERKDMEDLRTRIQQRVDVLLKHGRSFTDERREQLLNAGVRVTVEENPEETENTQDNEQGQESK